MYLLNYLSNDNFFHALRFVNTTAEVQKQALQWLQKLCLLEIPVPLDVLFEMLNNGAEALIQVFF